MSSVPKIRYIIHYYLLWRIDFSNLRFGANKLQEINCKKLLQPSAQFKTNNQLIMNSRHWFQIIDSVCLNGGKAAADYNK